MTRTCSRCGKVKPIDEYPLRRLDGTRRYTHCRDCKALYQKEWYERNKARHMDKVGERRRNVRTQNRMLVRRMKDVPCADCGTRYPYYVMDFDHVRG